MGAALLSSVADLLLLYHPEGGFLDPIPTFYGDISSSRMIWGHFLGIFFIPLELMGFLLVYKGLKPAGARKAKALAALAIYSTFPGVAYHGTCAMMGHMIQNGGQAELVSSFRILADPLAVAFILGFLILSIIISVVVGRGKSLFPRWVAFFNPVSIYLVFFACWFLVPVIGRFLLPAGFNLAMFIFLTLCFLTFKPAEAEEA